MSLDIKRQICFIRLKEPYPIDAIGPIWISKDRLSILDVYTNNDYCRIRNRILSKEWDKESLNEIQLLKLKNYSQRLNERLYSFKIE